MTATGAGSGARSEPSRVAERLLAWFRREARSLPWRQEPRDPYHVLVSELMLQQTQVDRVRPRFLEFIARFPSLVAVAEASQEQVVEAWSGLGYYRRARLLHRLAREVITAGGALPERARELQRLPGIGPYTAAAVASLAFGEAVAVLDGNVARVGARFLALAGDPRSTAGGRQISTWVEDLLRGCRPGEVNEALMELGATVCAPLGPACHRCPLADWCQARAEGRPEAYPPPREVREPEDVTWVAACCFGSDRRWLLHRIDSGPILRGLWLPPLAALERDVDPAVTAQAMVPLPTCRQLEGSVIRHAITHRRITVHPVFLEACDPVTRLEDAEGSWQWADPLDPGLPTSSLLAKIATRSQPRLL